jgi:hypothetical protein
MQITPKGRAVVESPEFTQRLREVVAACHEEGIEEGKGKALIATLVTWAAIGGDFRHPPNSGEQLVELAQFIHAHASEVDTLVGKCLENLVEHDTGAKVQ